MRFAQNFVFLMISAGLSCSVYADQAPLSQPPHPAQERYCDPTENAPAFAKIKGYEEQLAALDNAKGQVQESKKMELIHTLHQSHLALKCTTRKTQ